MTEVAVQLGEWERLSPETTPALHGLQLSAGRAVATDLTRSGKLEVLELAQGVEIRASSWVGRIELGELTVTVQPKIPGAPFLHLFRYAFALRQLSILDAARYGTEQGTFQDLIVRQLASEVEELIARGLHRDYRREPAELAAPRGRIDFQRYVMAAGAGRASLPCVHHPRTRSTFVNRVLMSGLVLAARVIDDVELRARLRRMARAIDVDDPPLRLNGDVLGRAWRTMDRRTRAYEPAIELIGLVMQAVGISLDARAESLRLPGFLFDMNRFFQALLSRFLGENLVGYVVRDEHRLQGMFAFAPSGNPRGRRAPTPRPDFAVLAGERVISVLDAKYRDLWAQGLPREMLYQLALYALGRGGADRRAVILYPTLESAATDQTIVMKEPVRGSEQARVVLRPVKLLELEALISAPASVKRERRRRDLATRLVFGGA